MGSISSIALLTTENDTSVFSCGVLSLDEWLNKRALKNQNSGASRTFVVCDDDTVIAYYALATGGVERSMAPNAIARNMPEAIPVLVLGRLAIDESYQGQKLGAFLLKDAILRTLSIAHDVGVRALLVHAISEDAKQFYMNYGFKISPIDPMTLMLSVKNMMTD